MYLLHESRCRPCVLSRSTARDDSLNHCPNGLFSASPLTNQPNENCVHFTRTNISKSPIISRTHLPFFWSFTRLPHISSPNSQCFSPVRDWLFHRSDHKVCGNFYRQYSITNNCHYLTWCQYSTGKLGHLSPRQCVIWNHLTWNVTALNNSGLTYKRGTSGQ